MSYHIVIEPTEYPQYSAVIAPEHILTLPFHDLGQGSIPARNWVWEHALAAGHQWHWVLDDNIRKFYRLYQNTYYEVIDGTTFAVVEDFVERYTNVVHAGMQYRWFVKKKHKHPPFIWNTRIYSCILLRNDLPYRWRGRYNEDTDLSLRILKDGWCTVLFYAFLAEKQTTMSMKGGNTDALYQGDGRWQMALSLQQQHPDCVRVVQKFHRWQHQVDYRRWRHNIPRLKAGIVITSELQEYGMVIPARRESADGA